MEPMSATKGLTPKRRHQLMKQATAQVSGKPLDSDLHKSSVSQMSPSTTQKIYSA